MRTDFYFLRDAPLILIQITIITNSRARVFAACLLVPHWSKRFYFFNCSWGKYSSHNRLISMVQRLRRLRRDQCRVTTGRRFHVQVCVRRACVSVLYCDQTIIIQIRRVASLFFYIFNLSPFGLKWFVFVLRYVKPTAPSSYKTAESLPAQRWEAASVRVRLHRCHSINNSSSITLIWFPRGRRYLYDPEQ